MVAHPRAAAGINRLRPLNQPKPIQVQEDTRGNPIAVIYRGRRIAIERVNDRWRIDDEWWRKEIARLYHKVVLKDGRILTIFRDLLEGGWFMQSVTLSLLRQNNLHVFIGHATRAVRAGADDNAQHEPCCE